ncbi:hypothetical protein JYJ95_31530 [Corallococcus exiguus]|uniref:glycosyltransferase n=1 Tax=Corallococcus exiguus TaxID=83462 RepID=UPI001A8CD876|nr:hypothetical protein [Corallococcus exiguus]MBN8471058.1 hypothetical protein [Corallococcus exiguus]
MSTRTRLYLEAEPFQNAAGAINAWMEEELRALGHDVERFNRHYPNPGDSGIPVANARRVLALHTRPAADLAIYCDMGLGIRAPNRELARRTFVFFHGLHGHPATWLGNPLIDLYGALSPYMHDTIESLLLTPDWSGRRCLDPRAAANVSTMVPTLPCLEAPDGEGRLPGVELPRTVQEALDRGEVLGHAIQPGKADWQAVCSILLGLRAQAREHGHRPVRLVVAAQDFAMLQHVLRFGFPFQAHALAQALQAANATLEDLLLPVPHLSQPSLFRLVREARFGLSYNVTPEPFGMYVLESVLNGCPVYTNGAGNNRYALPPGHGILVHETEAMAAGAPDAYASLAARIFQDVLAPAPLREACQRGSALIRRTFTRVAFASSFRACLSRLESDAARPTWAFEDLVVRLSPTVRRLDAASGRFRSDYRDDQLGEEEQALLPRVLGKSAGDVLRGAPPLAPLEALFDKGVLSLATPESARPPGSTPGAWAWYPPDSAFLEPSLLRDPGPR